MMYPYVNIESVFVLKREMFMVSKYLRNSIKLRRNLDCTLDRIYALGEKTKSSRDYDLYMNIIAALVHTLKQYCHFRFWSIATLIVQGIDFV